ncbi:MAG: T9SS type A sorting domain-containing protein [Bacteroidota bacterium]|nr:T9SS type A sorting domain-containing protein [Bacteroidota bacterium]
MKQILYKILFFSLVINSCFGQTLVNVTPCNINVSQSLTGFEPDPVYGPWIWSYDTLTITNNSNCDIRVRPEFDVSHESSPIGATDFNLKWYNPFTGNWPIIPYYIDANGNAVGYWSIGGDSTGIILNQGTSQQIIIKVRFKPSANYGLYSASWSTQLLDSSGVFVQNLAMDSSFLSLIDCSIFEVDSFYSTNSNCYNSNTGGAAIVSIQNGSGQYIYNWSNGDTTNNVTNLGPGNYDCIITDQNWQQCTDTISISIDEPDSLNITENINPLLCFGDNNASVNLTISGGISPYNEIWANGITPNNLGPGIYSYTIIDSNGCTVNDSIIILEPIELTSTISSVDITNCIIDDGAIDLNVGGGTGQISYTWNNGSTNEDLVNLSAGTYIVVISDSNGCILTDTAVIDNYVSLLSISLSSPLYNGENLNCYADNSGSISSTTTGGVGQLIYTWSNGQTATSISNLSAGTYSLNIIDGLGCSATESIILSQPDELTSTYTKTDVSCFNANDGSAIVNFFGGTTGSVPGDTNYILGWQGLTNILFNPIAQFETSVVAPNGIPAGIYPYSVTDLNGCTIYDTITIIEPDSLFITYTTSNFSGFEIDCAGENSGEINIQVNGGTAPFNHYLNGITQNSYNITNLVAGNYMDSIIDFNGCSTSVSITLYEPDTLNGSLTSTQLDCYGDCDGEIYSSINGGVLPYNLQWNTGDTTDTITGICDGSYNLSITDQNGCSENVTISLIEPDEINVVVDSLIDVNNYGGSDGAIYITLSGGTSPYNIVWTNNNTFLSFDEDLTNLSAGIYFLEITDDNSCIHYDTLDIMQPPSLYITLDGSTNAICFDSCNGEINITANGGDSTYFYFWTGPNGFTSTSEDISNLCYGEYILTLDDGISSVTDTFNIFQPQPFVSNLIIDSINCYNDFTQAVINVWGGTQPYTYNWSSGGNNYFTSLNAGTYSVSVSDVNGCSMSESFTINNPDSIISIATTSNTSCFGGNDGSTNISIISGGTAPFMFSSNNGLTYQNSNIFSNLSVGNYSILISDSNNCLDSLNIEINSPSEIYSITSSDSLSCYNLCDGNVYVTAFGGTPPYNYSWDYGTSNLCAGLYNVIITDLNNCTSVNNAIVSEPDPLLINIYISDSTLVATSGYNSYQWYSADGNIVNGATNETFTPNTVGEYYVIVNNGECEETSYSIDYNISNILEIENNLQIYPNPTNGIITIIGEKIKNISVYNILGNQLFKVEKNNLNINSRNIDLSNLARGIYTIQIEQNNKILNYQIILK